MILHTEVLYVLHKKGVAMTVTQDNTARPATREAEPRVPFDGGVGLLSSLPAAEGGGE